MISKNLQKLQKFSPLNDLTYTVGEELEMMSWRLLKYWQSSSNMCLQPLDHLNKQMGESKKYPSTTWIWTTGHLISGLVQHSVATQKR